MPRSVPLTVKPAVGEFDIGGGRFEQMRGDPQAFVDDFVGELLHDDARQAACARPEWAPPPTETRSVSPVTRRMRVDRHAEPFVDELREAGLVALALRQGADHDLDDAFRQHGDLGLLARRAGRGIDVIGDADAAIFAACLASARRAREAGPIAERERLVHDA